MIKFIYFFYLNRNNLSFSFIVLSFYRKLKRIQKRFKTFDTQDKVFLFFFSASISIACFTFCYLENPGLQIVDLYIVHTFFLTYFYLLAKKIANLNYFPSILLFMMSCPSLMFIVFSMIDFFNNEVCCFEWVNGGELSFLMQLILKGLNLFFSFLENSNIADCQPPDPIKLPNIPVPDLPLPKPIPPSTYKFAFTDGFKDGCMAIGAATALNATPRTRLVAGLTVGSISFLSHFV